MDKVHKFFKKHFSDQDVSDVFEKDSDYDTGRSVILTFFLENKYEIYRLSKNNILKGIKTQI